MLKQLTVQDRRDLFCQELRSGKHTQLRNRIGQWDIAGAPVCAQGLYYRIKSEEPRYRADISSPATIENMTTSVKNMQMAAADYWASELGLTQVQWHEMVRMNDTGSTFADIADWLEKQPC